ncbi:transcription factor A, mitochondrial-like isoform X2 [Pomacea canaliculata]|uniref:transcription factor A, mitochondrial-like isoform X2 n=1 Tax=Pomacea canaliculata TaxID=400727 RepID=UPI000D73FD1C|nr:transcription factor A, mitochondrial-like isoform X2 [Pomacea canaliculata]
MRYESIVPLVIFWRMLKTASPIKVKRQPVKPLHPEQMYIKKHLMKMKSKQPLTNRKEIYKKILERWENLPPRKRVKYHLQYIKDWEDFVKANEEFLDVDEITRQLMEVAPKDRKKKAKVIKSGKVWQRKKYGTKLQRLKEDYELQVQEFEKTVTRGSSKIQGDSELQ